MTGKGVRVEPQSLAKHFNEALILASLEGGPKHGYQLALDIEERSHERFGFKHGTLYPILHKLEKEGLIEGAWSDEGQRGKRKQYVLTPDGSRYLEELRMSWKDLMERFVGVIGEVKT
ncbi:PadR family transcriptional regulator [Gemmatimonadota bacterium]